MSRFIKVLLGLSLGVALLGAGLSAAWGGSSSSVSQTINVGSGLSMTLSSTTPGVVINPDGTVTCPAIAVGAPSGTDAVGCDFSIHTSAMPATVTVTMYSSAAGGDKFSMAYTSFGIGSGVRRLLTTAQSLPSAPFANPLHIMTTVSWGADSQGAVPLDGTDWGRSIVLTYAVTATP